jgi:hypothetical protein
MREDRMDDRSEAILDDAEKRLEEGRQSDARNLLAGYLKNNPRSERAWWLMSFAVTDQKQKIDCLNRVLSLNPSHEDARSRLDSIQHPTEPPEFKETAEEAWEVETTEDLEAEEIMGAETEEAVTEDLGTIEAPSGDFWVEEEEIIESAGESEMAWQQEKEPEDPQQERPSLWEDEQESDVRMESERESVWVDEQEADIQAADYQAAPEGERSSAPGPGAGVYRAEERESKPAIEKRGRSNRNLLLVVLLIFFLVAAIACVLLVLGFDLLQLF